MSGIAFGYLTLMMLENRSSPRSMMTAGLAPKASAYPRWRCTAWASRSPSRKLHWASVSALPPAMRKSPWRSPTARTRWLLQTAISSSSGADSSDPSGCRGMGLKRGHCKRILIDLVCADDCRVRTCLVLCCVRLRNPIHFVVNQLSNGVLRRRVPLEFARAELHEQDQHDRRNLHPDRSVDNLIRLKSSKDG